MALSVCFQSALPIAQGAEPITIAMTADYWQAKENAFFACFPRRPRRICRRTVWW